MTHTSVRVHAAAFLVALIEAGQVEEAQAFVDWCLEWLDLELSDTLTETLEGTDA